MKTLNFAKRNLKELIRDPLGIAFAIILPLFLLYIFQQFKIPNQMFKIEMFTPGIIVFSFSFITLFTATLIAKDRNTSLLTRLYASPMKPMEYICGYILAIMPIVILQNILFFALAIILGLTVSINILWTILVSIPVSILFIALAILIGSIATEKSAEGISSITVQLVAFTSGMYFPTEMVGGFFNTICNILPFSRCLNIIKGILNADYSNMGINVIILSIYTIVILLSGIFVFKKKMISDNK